MHACPSCMYVCMSVCLPVCMYVCMYICMYTYKHKHNLRTLCARAGMCALTHCMCKDIQYTCRFMCMYIHTHGVTRNKIHAFLCFCIVFNPRRILEPRTVSIPRITTSLSSRLEAPGGFSCRLPVDREAQRLSGMLWVFDF